MTNNRSNLPVNFDRDVLVLDAGLCCGSTFEIGPVRTASEKTQTKNRERNNGRYAWGRTSKSWVSIEQLPPPS